MVRRNRRQVALAVRRHRLRLTGIKQINVYRRVAANWTLGQVLRSGCSQSERQTAYDRAFDIREHEVDVVAVRVFREARSTAARALNECRIAELAEEAVFGGRAQRWRLRQAFLHQLADARAIAAEANRIESGNTVELGKIRSRENGD